MELADGIIQAVAKISDALDELEALPGKWGHKDPKELARVIEALRHELAWIDGIKVDAEIIKEMAKRGSDGEQNI